MKTTEHGENIANQIQDFDAYGKRGELTMSDVWLILDNIQTNLLGDENCSLEDKNKEEINLIGKWMDELQETYDIDVF